MNDQKEQKKKNNNKIKSIVKIVIILTLIVLILAITLITVFCTTIASNLTFLNYKFYVMEAESQPYIAEKGDLVIVKKAKPGEVIKKDNIVFRDGEFYYCDNVVETKMINTVYKMIIAENEGVRYQFAEDEIEGKVVRKISNLGNIILFLRTPIGVLLFTIFVICVFLLLRILFVKNDSEKVDKEKTDDESNELQKTNITNKLETKEKIKK